MNNDLMDYIYDLKDKYKTHFGLTSGKLDFRTATQINCILIMISAIFITYLTQVNFIALLFLLICTLSGFHYNYYCKKTLFAPISISICFGLLIGISYFSTTSTIDYSLILLCICYGFAQIWVQISVLGYAKDIESDKINLFRYWGSKLDEDKLIISNKVKIYGWLSKLPMPIFGFLIWNEANGSLPSLLLFTMVVVSTFCLYKYILSSHKWSHKKTLTHCGGVEISTYFGLLIVLENVLGWIVIGIMIILPLLWYIGWIRVFWGRGRGIAPRV